MESTAIRDLFVQVVAALSLSCNCFGSYVARLFLHQCGWHCNFKFFVPWFVTMGYAVACMCRARGRSLLVLVCHHGICFGVCVLGARGVDMTYHPPHGLALLVCVIYPQGVYLTGVNMGE